jgi:hypothetical protein
MSHFISIKINPETYKTFEVDKNVYIYICQLENAVKYEHTRERLKKLYSERFNGILSTFVDDLKQNEWFKEYE